MSRPHRFGDARRGEPYAWCAEWVDEVLQEQAAEPRWGRRIFVDSLRDSYPRDSMAREGLAAFDLARRALEGKDTILELRVRFNLGYASVPVTEIPTAEQVAQSIEARGRDFAQVFLIDRERFNNSDDVEVPFVDDGTVGLPTDCRAWIGSYEPAPDDGTWTRSLWVAAPISRDDT